MSDLVFLLDMDGVIADFIGKLLKIYKERYGVSYTHADVTHFMFEKCFDKATADKMYPLFNEPGFFADLEKIQHADETVTALLGLGHVEICTTPPKVHSGDNASRASVEKKTRSLNHYSVADKLVWINDHFPQLSKHVTLTGKKHLIRGDVLIDDGMHNIKPWCGAHPKGLGLVVEQPWNVNEPIPSNAIRVPLRDSAKVIEDWLKRRA